MRTVITYRAQADSLARLDLDASTLDEATLQLGHGIYTVIRLYSGRRLVRWDAHIRRLRRSAELLDMPFVISGDWLRDLTRRAVEESGFDLSRLRLTIPFAAPDSALIMIEPFAPPSPSLYEQGVRVAPVDMQRQRPQAKHTRFIERRQQAEASKPPGVYELILVNGDGYLHEGATSNFYGLLGGQLHTADEDGALAGIARAVLLDVAPGVIPIGFTMVHRTQIEQLSEAILTSASRGVVPIVQIGDVQIGDGRPGPVARRLGECYDAQIERELEPL